MWVIRLVISIQVLKNEDLRKLYEDCLLLQRECLREIDELRTALMMAKRGL